MTSLSLAAQGLLDRGALPALTIAAQGFLREAAAEEAGVTTAGRAAGTQYRAKTISRELREKARKAARRLRTRVVARLETESWFDNAETAQAVLSYIDDAIADTFVPKFEDEGTAKVIMDAAIAFLVREAELRVEEQDDELLLLAA